MAWLENPATESLSKTTKLILLDSLLQEVCIKSGSAGRSPLSSLRLSFCLCQSQPSLFRTKESPLNIIIANIILIYNNIDIVSTYQSVNFSKQDMILSDLLQYQISPETKIKTY